MESHTGVPIELTPDAVIVWCGRCFGAWNSRDPGQLAELCTEDIIWEDPYIRGGRLTGKRALREWSRSLFTAMPDLNFTLVGEPFLTVDGVKAGGVWHGTATFTAPLDPPGFAPTRGKVDVTGIDLYEFRSGLLSRVLTCTDTMQLARQIGAAPEEDTALERLGVKMQHLQARRMRRKA
jgi:hypothetical protein